MRLVDSPLVLNEVLFNTLISPLLRLLLLVFASVVVFAAEEDLFPPPSSTSRLHPALIISPKKWLCLTPKDGGTKGKVLELFVFVCVCVCACESPNTEQQLEPSFVPFFSFITSVLPLFPLQRVPPAAVCLRSTRNRVG